MHPFCINKASNISRFAVLALALFLAGCAQLPAVEPRVAAAAPAAQAASTAPRTLLLYTHEEGPGLAFVQKLAEEFSAPAGWRVDIISKPSDLLLLDVETAALAQNPPDVLWTSNRHVAPLAAADLLQPLDVLFDPARFVPALVEAASFNGQRWGVPVSGADGMLLLYNRRLIPSPPRTIDELLRLEMPPGAEVLLVNNPAEPLWLLPWLAGFGGRPVDQSGRPTLNTPAMVQTIGLLDRLRDAGNPAQEVDFAGGDMLFREGRAAMIVNGEWSVGSYAGLPNVDLGVAPLPAVSATGTPARSLVSGTYLMLPRGLTDEKLEAARAFAGYVTGVAVQSRLAGEAGRLPALAAALASETIRSDPRLGPAASALEQGQALPPMVATDILFEAMRPALQSALSGETPAGSAAQEMQLAAEAVLGGP